MGRQPLGVGNRIQEADMNRCCDDFTGECNSGRNCPARAARTTWCETSRQPCTQPYTCASGCQVKAYNAGLEPVYVWRLTTMGWAVLACLAFWLAAIAVYFYWD